jgi:hypothetical protein
MTTAQQIITDAYHEAQVIDEIESPNGSQSSRGLRWLNRIVSLLSNKNVSIPYSTSENFEVSSLSASYTMGSGGTASTARAKKILNAFVRDSGGIDRQVRIVSEQDYNLLGDKDLSGCPYLLFYDPVYPVGIINLYPQPDTSYTVYIESQKDLQSTLSFGTSLTLTPDYEDLLVTQLAKKIGKTYSSPNYRALVSDAREAWLNIATHNLSKTIPEARLPFSRPGSGTQSSTGGIGDAILSESGDFLELE